jgi:hypothetical protein
VNEDNSDHENDSNNVKELSNLVNYLTPVKFQSFEYAEGSLKLLMKTRNLKKTYYYLELNRSYELSM